MKPTKEITLKELAKILHFRQSTLLHHVAIGGLPKPIGGDIGCNSETDCSLVFNKKEVAEKLGLDNLDEPFVNLQGAADFLRVPKTAVQALIKDKYLPLPCWQIAYLKKNNKSRSLSFRFRISELEKYLQQRQDTNLAFKGNKQIIKTNEIKIRHWLEVFKLVLSSVKLDDQAREVLQLRLVENKTVQEISNSLDLSNERLRQIFIKALAKLRLQVSSLQRIRKSLDEQFELTRQLVIENKNLKKQLLKLETDIVKEEEFRATTPLPVEELDLSARILHCLAKSNVKDLRQLSEFSSEYMLKFRNFGKKSFVEITEKMAHYGIKFIDG